ncbi:hypothetical protein [Pseudochrobactrum sp. MP213Fo]|uniref:hypothetical protein n=1 Tax=Pseudochrobactrum sp. MP213Fo TaxID=3022250 RepID=UPI003BA1A758
MNQLDSYDNAKTLKSRASAAIKLDRYPLWLLQASPKGLSARTELFLASCFKLHHMTVRIIPDRFAVIRVVSGKAGTGFPSETMFEQTDRAAFLLKRKVKTL